MKSPLMTEVFVVREAVALKHDVQVLKKTGAIKSSLLSDLLRWGVKEAFESDGNLLPYKGKPPEGSFFFIQSPASYSGGSPRLCLHVNDPKLGLHSNFEWHASDPNEPLEPEDGAEGDYRIGSRWQSGGNEFKQRDPDHHGMWLSLQNSELEDWIKPKASQDKGSLRV
jgi:hypothetical protein